MHRNDPALYYFLPRIDLDPAVQHSLLVLAYAEWQANEFCAVSALDNRFINAELIPNLYQLAHNYNKIILIEPYQNSLIITLPIDLFKSLLTPMTDEQYATRIYDLIKQNITPAPPINKFSPAIIDYSALTAGYQFAINLDRDLPLTTSIDLLLLTEAMWSWQQNQQWQARIDNPYAPQAGPYRVDLINELGRDIFSLQEPCAFWNNTTKTLTLTSQIANKLFYLARNKQPVILRPAEKKHERLLTEHLSWLTWQEVTINGHAYYATFIPHKHPQFHSYKKFTYLIELLTKLSAITSTSLGNALLAHHTAQGFKLNQPNLLVIDNSIFKAIFSDFVVRDNLPAARLNLDFSVPAAAKCSVPTPIAPAPSSRTAKPSFFKANTDLAALQKVYQQLNWQNFADPMSSRHYVWTNFTSSIENWQHDQQNINNFINQANHCFNYSPWAAWVDWQGLRATLYLPKTWATQLAVSHTRQTLMRLY